MSDQTKIASEFKDTTTKPTDFDDLTQLEEVDMRKTIVVRDAVNESIPSQNAWLKDDVLIKVLEDVNHDVGAPFEKEAVEAASKLSNPDYQRYRKQLPGLSGQLDKVVDKSKKQQGGRGDNLDDEFQDTEPWLEPVDGQKIIEDAMDKLRQFMIMEDDHILIAVLWALHTHAYAEFDHTPRLLITSPDYGCAKSLLMKDLVGGMSNRPWWVENITAPVLFRTVEMYKPTVLVDEVDTFINQDDVAIMGVINAGWDSKGRVSRCSGDDYEVKHYSTHAPLAMSGIKLGDKLHPATLSRSLKITLEKATPQEVNSNFRKFSRKKHEHIFLQIGRKFARWMQDHRHEIRDVIVEIPQAMEMRDFDTYEPLAILAKMVGPNILDQCMRALYAQKDIAPPSVDKQLLASIREVIKSDEDKIHTGELIKRLCENLESRWRNMNPKNADPERCKIQDYQIARILAGYKGVKPKTLNIKGQRLKGYYIEPLRNAWERYLRDTPLLSSNDGASSESADVTSSPEVTPPKSTKPNGRAASNGVTATEEENREKEGNTTDTKSNANDDVYDRDPVRVRGSI